MGMAHMALAAVMAAGVLAGASQALALELGALQAIPSSYPPYIFRLPIISQPHSPAAVAAVTVRQPPDALSFVQKNVLELRLRSLTDVELEVSQEGQTLNRLLLKSELLGARAQVEAARASNPTQLARADGRGRPLAEGSPLAPTAEGVPDRALLESELEWIRQEIQNLVGGVTPWVEPAPPAGHSGESSAIAVFTLMLGGLFIAGVTSLVTGYVMQRRAIDPERRRRRALAMSMRRRQAQLTVKGATLAGVVPVSLSPAPPEALEPVAIRRRIRVSQRTQRRIHIWSSREMRAGAPGRTAARTRVVAPPSQRLPSAPAGLVEALAQLRHELMRLQGRLPTSTTDNSSEAGSGRAAH
jgi:hypothetical protein